MQADERKYQFSWDTIGSDLAISRPSLGESTRIEVYRLLQFSLRDVIEQDYGPEVADDMFRRAGVLAGRAFFNHFGQDVKDSNAFIKLLQELFKDFGIGIFRVESFDLETMECVLTIDEDLDCSGLPDIEGHICVYDEGFISGILEAFTGKKFTVREIDCWCTGARTCRFNGKPSE